MLGLQRIDVPALPQAVYREAILNAVAHRNYGLPGNVILRHFPDRLEVMSPGGFPAGVSPANILRQVVSRNRLLAEVLQRVGYVERAGYGVDMMYEQMLRLGKEPPWFIPDDMSVRVVIRDTTFDEPFVAFVQRRLRAEPRRLRGSRSRRSTAPIATRTTTPAVSTRTIAIAFTPATRPRLRRPRRRRL